MLRRITSSDLIELARTNTGWRDGEPGCHQADLSNTDLSHMDLSSIDLRGANLCEANLRGADLSSIDLREANLCGADLCGADLRRADLRGADLRGADLRKVNMASPDLREADLRGADLDFASWPLWCGGTQVRLDRRRSLQLIYHAFNQDHEDLDIRTALEALRPLAQEFITQHHVAAPELRR